MAIKYGGKIVDDYSAMQGPAPSGYHVPSKDEWTALCGILTGTFGLANNDTTMGTYLKMPMAGYRNWTNANVYPVSGRYWSSTPYNVNLSYFLYITSSYFGSQDTSRCPHGYSVRCFKDSPTIPTSSWTTLYDGSSIATGVGIFYNATDGVISVSGDGTTWYTIMDKNLGATTVFNQGDTLTDANCGYFYQWGNNYGFPHSGTVTISNTPVDASNYGPGNYYSSSTFICGVANWSSVRNDDLWGGETGVQQRPVDLVKRYYGGKIIDDYSAMQGPAPSGFHVPLTTEWQAVYDVWTALGGRDRDGTNFGIALKLPFAGFRDNEDSIASSQNTNGRYWSSSNPSDADGSYCLRFSKYIRPQEYDYRARGFSVRCFKNSPVVPTSNWTKLYGTSIEAGGIFWSSADGLISLSSDGQTWITIMDKNLGATTVWNSGDTLSEANCGKYYQWGNNYGFPRTGTIANQSTIQVDASNYGPGNYYSSDTFIKYNGRWDTTDNGNLWGGVTGAIQRPAEVKKVYYGSTQIRPTWQPGANTIAYFPFSSDSLDATGNNTLTNSGTQDGLGWKFMSGSNITTPSGTVAYVNYRIKINAYPSGTSAICLSNQKGMGYYPAHQTNPALSRKIFVWYNSSFDAGSVTFQPTAGTWHNISYGFDGMKTIYSIDGVSGILYNGDGYNFGDTFIVTQGGDIVISKLILETTARSNQEITDYYNQTKGKYEQQQSGGSGQGENNGGNR